MAVGVFLIYFFVAILIVLIVAAFIAIALVIVRRGRHHRSVRVHRESMGDQPYLVSQPIAETDHALLRTVEDELAPGTVVPVVVPTQDGKQERQVPISRLGRRQTAGDPRTVEVTAYLQAFEGWELPISLPVRADRDVQRLRLDEHGVSGTDASGAERFGAPWERLEFVDGPNGSSVRLFCGDAVLTVDRTAGNGVLAHDLLVKYARLQPAHRRRSGRARADARSLDEVHQQRATRQE